MANEKEKNPNADGAAAWKALSPVAQNEILRELGFFQGATGKPPAGYDVNGKPITTTPVTTAGTKPATSEPVRSTTTSVTPSTDPGVQRADNLTGMISGAVGNSQSLYGDYYNQAMNFDPTKTDWGKAILSYYGIESGAAANGANASGAAENAGNVDSYAAANAQRQRLATLNQGINAVSSVANQKFSSALQGLQAMGVDVNALLGIEGGNVGNTQGYLASIYRADETAAANAPKTYPKYTDAEGAYIADQTFGLDFDFNGATAESLEKIKAAVAEKIASTFGLGPADAAAKAENAVNTIYQKAIGQ
jgi:hypothetical protein